ncbi:hypothetical protein FISHEDRAFT_49107 [Fistulina hepatica ATCC 64428]|uniref:Tcp11-domain-containing protein n=1 Tax=Fistulina hepatica ATCC 64428 TaxID=1128425 RepID=A0A0D7A6R9_9AGAR|nr:hypothetical protein FISHEDRAFT_49107 [Fistulina hepatica ATCC 64428]
MPSSPSSPHRADASAKRLKKLCSSSRTSPVARTADDADSHRARRGVTRLLIPHSGSRSAATSPTSPACAGPSPRQFPPFEASRAIQLLDPEWNHIPTMHPLVNREALKELDLDCILRNPQLRHDLLFDAGLQFRPMYSRKKRDMAERYWRSIVQELETGCTCVSFDRNFQPRAAPMCVCSEVPLPPKVPVTKSFPDGFTIRMPTRIRLLLDEFLAVILVVIQPLSGAAASYVNPQALSRHVREHSAQAQQIRDMFDPALIEQELHHNVFDPSGLLLSIGAMLKRHCAPMRDCAIENMLQAARACAPEAGGTELHAVKTFRMCLEILELMKLDIANHQIQGLRPSLLSTCGETELRAFRKRRGSMHVTGQWLRASHRDLIAHSTIPNPTIVGEQLEYAALRRSQQVFVAAIWGWVNLIFIPPSPAGVPSMLSSDRRSLSCAVTTLPPSTALAYQYPETAYLDVARLAMLTGAAATTQVLHMLLLLFRQLLVADGGRPAFDATAQLTVLTKVKAELRAIGSSKLGYALSPPGTLPRDYERWCSIRENLVAQVALRATEAREGFLSEIPISSETSSSSLSYVPLSAPCPKLLGIAKHWVATNVQPGVPFCRMLRDRMRDVVFHAVLVACCAPRKPAPPLPAIMEPLRDELAVLIDKTSKLAMVHLNAYLPLYEGMNSIPSVQARQTQASSSPRPLPAASAPSASAASVPTSNC